MPCGCDPFPSWSSNATFHTVMNCQVLSAQSTFDGCILIINVTFFRPRSTLNTSPATVTFGSNRLKCQASTPGYWAQLARTIWWRYWFLWRRRQNSSFDIASAITLMSFDLSSIFVVAHLTVLWRKFRLMLLLPMTWARWSFRSVDAENILLRKSFSHVEL